MGPLTGIRVLDLTECQSGPFCTMILSDLGAEVIKLENPKTGGDPSRYEGVGTNNQTVAYAGPNRGKKSMLMDLNNEDQKALFLQMVKDADVVVDSFKPGTMEALGCGYEVLKAINPKVVCTSITPFGQTGPWKDRAGEDMTAQALGGLMSMVGDLGQRPVKVGIDMADKLAGFYGCISTLTALYEAMGSGEGQYIDIAKMDSIMASMENPYARYDMAGTIPKTQGNRHPSSVPFGNYTCGDGKELIVNISTDDQFAKLADVLGEPEMAQGKYALSVDRVKYRDELDPKIYELFGKFTAEELSEKFDALNIPYNVINDVKAIAETEHMAYRKMVADVVYPDGTVIKTVATPLKMTDMEEKTVYTGAVLGQDTIEIASRYMSEEEAHALYNAALDEAAAVFAEKQK